MPIFDTLQPLRNTASVACSPSSGRCGARGSDPGPPAPA